MIAIIALSLTGLFIGARLNVFSLALVEVAVIAATVLSELHAGAISAVIWAATGALALCAGFVLGMLLSYLAERPLSLNSVGGEANWRWPLLLRINRHR